MTIKVHMTADAAFLMASPFYPEYPEVNEVNTLVAVFRIMRKGEVWKICYIDSCRSSNERQLCIEETDNSFKSFDEAKEHLEIMLFTYAV